MGHQKKEKIVKPPEQPVAGEATAAALPQGDVPTAPVTVVGEKPAKAKKEKKARVKKEKPAAPPKPTIWGLSVSAVARALGQQTQSKAKVIVQFVASKGIAMVDESVSRQALRARRCLKPGYDGEGASGYFKLGEVPKLTPEQVAEFETFEKSLPPPPPKEEKKLAPPDAAAAPAPATDTASPTPPTPPTPPAAV